MSKDCIGCKQIKDKAFPFHNEGKKYFIDMEGCGITFDEKRLNDLEIIYCPVCGDKI